MTTTAAPPSPVHRAPGSGRREEEDAPGNGPRLPTPTLRLHVNDLRHPASAAFLSLLPDVKAVLETALAAIIRHLYTPPSLPPFPSPTAQDAPSSASASAAAPATQTKRPCFFTPSVPPTRSVTVILRDFGGVAYTTGTELDNDHKEIHFSLSYIRRCATSFADPASELAGVLTHELVHCYQHTAPPASADDGGGRSDPGSVPHPPGGLIEGVADFVRLKAGLVPPHWRRPASARDRPPRWDQGYQHTAFFLEWLEDVRVGTGAVGMLNDRLLRVGYVGEDDARASGDGERAREEEAADRGALKDNGKESFWKGLFGVGVRELWEEYGRYLDGLGGQEGEKKRTASESTSNDHESRN